MNSFDALKIDLCFDGDLAQNALDESALRDPQYSLSANAKHLTKPIIIQLLLGLLQ